MISKVNGTGDKEEIGLLKKRIIKVRRKINESKLLFQSESKEAINRAIESIKLHRLELETYISLHP